jgi:hypothetical protein
MQTNRVKVFRVGARDLLHAVYGTKNAAYRTLGCSCLPEGFTVLGGTSMPLMAPPAVEMLVAHDSFDEVPDCQMPPMVFCRCRLNVVKVEEDVAPALVVNGAS